MCYKGRGGAKDMEKIKAPRDGKEAETTEKRRSHDEDWFTWYAGIFPNLFQTP